MQATYWQKIESIFFEAVSLPAEEQREFIKQQSGDNAELYREVCLLLDTDNQKNSFLDEPLFTLGAQILASDEDWLFENDEFGHYKLQKLLGRGGMGVVFLAEDTRLHRLAALKVLPKSLSEDKKTIDRFHQEARAASKVSHQNVAHIYEFGRWQGRNYLAMEYIRGENLRVFIKNHPIDIKKAVNIALQIADALETAHQSGIIHRDIKPENVIVNQNNVVKVLDFGLAKLIEFDESGNVKSASTIETVPGLIMGTAAYMSPEQIRSQEISRTSDIWSLGVILYEMLTGKRPFDGETSGDVIASVIKNEPLSPRKLNKNISAKLEKIVLKCLNKDSRERFQNAGELIDEITQFEAKSDSAFRLKKKPPAARDGFKFTRQTESIKPKYRKSFVAGILILSLAILSFGFWIYGGDLLDSTTATSASIESIAVLPFINESGNPEQEYLSDGMTESLINRLSQLPDLKVKARSSVFYYKNKNLPPQFIGSELNVQAVLLGRVSEKDKELKISLELIDVKTGNLIWGEKYSRNINDLAFLEVEIAGMVSHKIVTRQNRLQKSNLTKNYTQNAEALQLYLHGRFHWSKRTAKDLQRSVEYYEQAVALDPNFALAYAGLADSYVLLSGYAVSSPRESFPKAKAAARKAIEIDETLAEAHTVLSYVLFNFDWNFAESEVEIKRAVELNANYATAHHWYGNANLLANGHFEESIAELKKAQELDPLSLIINSDLATSYLYSNQLDNAVAQYEKTLEMDENFYYAHTYLGRTYLMKGDYEQAVAELQKAQKLGDDPRILMLLARTYTAMNNREKAFQIIAQLKTMSAQKYISAYYFALIYAGFDDKDKAFEWLEKALQDREGRMTMIKVDPLLANLRSDRRFADLVKRVGFSH